MILVQRWADAQPQRQPSVNSRSTLAGSTRLSSRDSPGDSQLARVHFFPAQRWSQAPRPGAARLGGARRTVEGCDTGSEPMGSLTQKNRPTLPLAMASDRSLSSASGSSRAPHESPCLAMAGAGSSTTIQRLLPIRSARPRERFSDLLTMIDGKSMATLSYVYLWVFELRARLRAQQSSLLMELESCFIQGASKLVPDGGDGRAAGVSTEPTAADLPSRVRRSPAL